MSLLPLWRQIQRQNFTSPLKLADYLELDRIKRSQIDLSPSFLLNLPFRLARKMEKNCLEDPLVRQFLPLKEEMIARVGYLKDPLLEVESRMTPKLLKKYQGRALLIATGACAMHCRYCFRREFDYAAPSDFAQELLEIEEDSSLHEIILSGGDPLSLGNPQLEALLQSLDRIPHLKLLRFHTRFPVGIPERIDSDLLKIFERVHKQLVFVIHINHPKELDEEIFSALKAVQRVGIPVLNQAVLLRGINDEVAVLAELFWEVSARGILPYYLHQLDPVEGAHHFEVEPETGLRLIEELTALLPGYAVPRYVQEIAGALSKLPIETLLHAGKSFHS